MKKATWKHTRLACYIGYINQAMILNLPPLLYVTFQQQLSLSMSQLTTLMALIFGVKLTVDAVAAFFVDRLGYKRSAVLAHFICFTGMVGVGLVPLVSTPSYAGLAIPLVVIAIGSGLIEVVISPIVEGMPSEQKSANMVLVHSFYSWGSVLIVLLSTAFFATLGITRWSYLYLFGSLVPLFNGLFFLAVPVQHMVAEGTRTLSLPNLFKNRFFIPLLIIIVCSGASELAMSQWISYYAEKGLQISKTMGDLLGPCMFAVLMGCGRVALGSSRIKVRLETIMAVGSVFCIAGYLIVSLTSNPVIALTGCGLCGLAVSAMWPTTFSIASKKIPMGSTLMFAMLALFGDIGATGGPTLVGYISGVVETRGLFAGRTPLSIGLLIAILFPILLLACLLWISRLDKSSADNAL